MPLEVEWYRRHGRYPQRIRMTAPITRVVRVRGMLKEVREPREPYVIGDFSWNNSVHPRMREEIEPRMRREGIYW